MAGAGASRQLRSGGRIESPGGPPVPCPRRSASLAPHRSASRLPKRRRRRGPRTRFVCRPAPRRAKPRRPRPPFSRSRCSRTPACRTLPWRLPAGAARSIHIVCSLPPPEIKPPPFPHRLNLPCTFPRRPERAAPFPLSLGEKAPLRRLEKMWKAAHTSTGRSCPEENRAGRRRGGEDGEKPERGKGTQRPAPADGPTAS